VEKTDDSVKLARGRHKAGDLAGAEEIYRQILAKTPRHSEAMHLLGALLGQRGETDTAIDLIRGSIEIEPNNAEARRNLGVLLAQTGRLDEALGQLRDAARLKPEDAQTHHDMAKILALRNQWEDSLARCRRAGELRPESAEIQRDIAVILVRRGRCDEAIAAYLKAIQLGPDVAVTHYGLGQAYHGAGRHEDAAEAYGEAARIKPDFVEALVDAANELCELGRVDEALSFHGRAVAIKPDAAIAWEALGRIMLRMQKVEEAVGHFRRAVDTDPNLISAWNSLGLALQHQGRFDEAAACFQRILSINPESTEARKNLVNTKRRDSTAEIEPPTKALARRDLPPEQRLAGEFALARALDDEGRFDEAFSHFAAGNELAKQKRASIGEHYDPAEFHSRVDRIIRLFTPELFEQRRGWGDPSELPVFVVGMPRSGTTLVQQIAASHPLVYGAGELDDIQNLTRKLGEKDAGEAAPQWGPESLRNAAVKHVDRLRKLSATALRIIDKMPSNLQHLGLISVLFPRARVVLCRRDTRDTCLSCYFQGFSSGNIFAFDLADCGHYAVECNRLMDHWRRALPLAMLEIQYEEVVADLEGQSRRLIEFLGLPWDPACLEFYRAETTVATSSVWEVRQPIYQRSVGRWRHYKKHLGPLFKALAGD